MDKLSVNENQKLLKILNQYKSFLSISVEEKAADIIESIVLEAKSKKSDISKARINLINTPYGPEIGVTFEEKN